MREQLQALIEYAKLLSGDEKGEAQVFCDRLFQAFGHAGYKEAGATLEFRVKGPKSTRFADLLWGNRVLIEMKKKGSKLQTHRAQIFDYWWKLRPDQPKYCVLCNFDEFIIFDFAIQDEPLDRVKLNDLLSRYTAFNFLFEHPVVPVFSNNLEEITRETVSKVAAVFHSLITRGEERKRAQRFILQSIFAMFAEDFDLLPPATFTSILIDCQQNGASSYDLFSALFHQMNSPNPARGGRFKDVDYFNGGLFADPEPIELTIKEIDLLLEASNKEWSKVNPAIFGTIFQESMDKGARHAYGAHFTSELDILKIVQPVIIQPLREKIQRAISLTELKDVRKQLSVLKILDPACGSGNFLYVAFRELRRVELELLNKIHTDFPKSANEIGTQSIVSVKQFFGMDYNEFAVELAKVTLMLAKEMAIRESQDWVNTLQLGISLTLEPTLPLDNMDSNVLFADALFTEWVNADIIIGNPPYQSKNKMQEEFGIAYLNKVWNAYPMISGLADYCVYWFYKAHQSLKVGGLAGLVGTNTVRQNNSREGSLDFIVKNGGTIFDAVSSQPWSGDAVVFVSIVSWCKGEFNGKKRLYVEDAEKNQIEYIVDEISSSLSLQTDVTMARPMSCNTSPKMVFQGQTHGHDGFLLSKTEGLRLLAQDNNLSAVIKPYLIGRELLANYQSQPDRFVIDFGQRDIIEASVFKLPFEIVKASVLPDRKQKSKEQAEKNEELLRIDPTAKVNKHHINFFNNWWKLSFGRTEMIDVLHLLKRYIACSRVSARPIFEFVSTTIRPNDALMVFAYEDDYTFGIIHASPHILWYKEKCSTLKGDPRYTTESIWDTFPFPQQPTLSDVKRVAAAAKALRQKRTAMMEQHHYTLRDIYRLVDEPGANPIKELSKALDNAVLTAYGFDKRKDILQQVLNLNLSLAANISEGLFIQGPGLPAFVTQKDAFISDDCVMIKDKLL